MESFNILTLIYRFKIRQVTSVKKWKIVQKHVKFVKIGMLVQFSIKLENCPWEIRQLVNIFDSSKKNND